MRERGLVEAGLPLLFVFGDFLNEGDDAPLDVLWQFRRRST